MSFSPTSITFLSTPEELFQFKSQWEKLYDDTGNVSPYLCFDWIYSVAKYFAPEETPLCVAVARNKSDVIGIIPLKHAQLRYGPKVFNVIQFFGDGWAPQNGGIFADEKHGSPILARLFETLLHTNRNLHFILLKKISLQSPFAHLYPSSDNYNQINAVQSKIGNSILIKLPKTWESYLDEISSAHKNTLKRRIKAFERDYKLSMIRLGLDTSSMLSDVLHLVHDAVLVSNNSWQGSSRKGRAISDSDTTSFFSEISAKLAAKRMLDLSVLYADSKPVSFIWGAARWPYSSILKLGYDITYEQYSPGTVHLAMLIRDSINRGGAEIDFGHEFSAYKSRWSRHYIDLYSTYYFPRRFESTLLCAGLIIKKKLKYLVGKR